MVMWSLHRSHDLHNALITWLNGWLWSSYEFFVATSVLIGTELCPCVIKRNSLIVDLFMTAERGGREREREKERLKNYVHITHCNKNTRLTPVYFSDIVASSRGWKLPLPRQRQQWQMLQTPSIQYSTHTKPYIYANREGTCKYVLPLHVGSQGRSQRLSHDLYTPSPLVSGPSYSLRCSHTSLLESVETYAPVHTVVTSRINASLRGAYPDLLCMYVVCPWGQTADRAMPGIAVQLVRELLLKP